MVNVTPKASALDVAGVVGLLAFLADKKACADRLEELQSLVVTADNATQALVEQQAKTQEYMERVAKQNEDAKALQVETRAAHAAVVARQEELDARIGKLAEAEKKNVEYATELHNLHAKLGTYETDLQNREVAVFEAENAVEAQKKDLEDRLNKLRAITGE